MDKLILALLLTGCATTQYVAAPTIEPPVIARPELDVDYLKPGDDAGTVIQAHRLTIKKLQSWGLQLEAALDAYRKTK